VDAVEQMLCKCQINVGTKGLSDPVALLETRNGMYFQRGGDVGQIT
jgi:hypothetical protein